MPTCRSFETEPDYIGGRPQGRTERKITEMTTPFALPRHARVILVFVMLSLVAGARAEDVSQPPEQQPATAPLGQKAAAGGGHGSVSNPPVAAELHRLPPVSTTKQTLVLPGRTLALTATAGSIRLVDDTGEPPADIAYTAYRQIGRAH